MVRIKILITYGIRINDKINNIVSVELPDILKEIPDGDALFWSILYLDTTGNLGDGKSVPIFQQQIYDSEKGFLITWSELFDLAKKFWDLMDITLIASKEINYLRRYEDDQEMYETCDIVIEMIALTGKCFQKTKSLLKNWCQSLKI